MTLDAFGTLFDLETVMLPAVESIISALGLPLDAGPLARTWTRRFHALHQSCALGGRDAFRTIRDVTEETLGRSLREFDTTGDVVCGTGIWFDHVISAPLYPEVRGAVERLASRFRLAVISDTDDDYFIPAWERCGLSPMLSTEFVFTSDSSRSYKLSPDGELFRRAFEALGVEPGCVAHIGDMPTDVIGAAAAGAKGVWLSREGLPWTDDRAEPTFIARDLAEAAERLVALA